MIQQPFLFFNVHHEDAHLEFDLKPRAWSHSPSLEPEQWSNNVPHGRVAHTGEPPTFAKTTPKPTLLWPVTAYFSPV
jgi:hypothetical protein